MLKGSAEVRKGSALDPLRNFWEKFLRTSKPSSKGNAPDLFIVKFLISKDSALDPLRNFWEKV